MACVVTPLKYLSFSSSGSHGILFEGILRALEDHVPDFDAWSHSLKGIAGTSGGALMALVVALRIGRAQRKLILRALSDLTNVIRCPNVGLMIQKYGLDDGETFRRIIQEILTLGGLSVASTLGDLRRLLRIELVFVAHDMREGKSVHLTAQTAPDMLVSDAVFASCCIPLVFVPFRHKEHVLCDGALSEHLPCVFPEDATLHVVVPVQSRCASVDSWYTFLHSLLMACLVPQKSRIDHILHLPNTIAAYHPFMEQVHGLEARMDDETLSVVTHCGYIAAMTFLHRDSLTPTLCQLVCRLMQLTHDAARAAFPNGECDSEDDPHD